MAGAVTASAGRRRPAAMPPTAGRLLRTAALALGAAVAVPLAVLFSVWAAPQTEVWEHLAATVLPGLVRNTLALLAGVGAGTLLLGCGLAWLTARCEFPGRRWLDVGLMLPLALPGMLTGTIIGMARALGESAPLLMIGMVAFIVDIPKGFTDPSTVLPVQIYLWSDSPERAFVERTSAAIMVLLAFLVVMNAGAIILRKKFERRW